MSNKSEDRGAEGGVSGTRPSGASAVEAAVTIAAAPGKGHGHGRWVRQALHLSGQLLAMGVATALLYLQLCFLRCKLGYTVLKERHLAFQKVDVIAEDGRRSVFADPLLDWGEWVHVALYTLRGGTPHRKTKGRAA